MIDGPPEIVEFAVYPDENLVEMPGPFCPVDSSVLTLTLSEIVAFVAPLASVLKVAEEDAPSCIFLL